MAGGSQCAGARQWMRGCARVQSFAKREEKLFEARAARQGTRVVGPSVLARELPPWSMKRWAAELWRGGAVWCCAAGMRQGQGHDANTRPPTPQARPRAQNHQQRPPLPTSPTKLPVKGLPSHPSSPRCLHPLVQPTQAPSHGPSDAHLGQPVVPSILCHFTRYAPNPSVQGLAKPEQDPAGTGGGACSPGSITTHRVPTLLPSSA